jgi:hypothetical protein
LCSASASFTVKVNPLPIAMITGDTVICNGEITTLTASGGIKYFWNFDNITQNTISVRPSVNAVYSVTVTNEFNCIARKSINIIVNQNPVVSISGDADICLNDSTILSLTGPGVVNSRFLWLTTGDTTQQITVKPTMNTFYNARVTFKNTGCFTIVSRLVTVSSCLGKESIVGKVTNMNGKLIQNYNIYNKNKDIVYTTNDDGVFKVDDINKDEKLRLQIGDQNNLLDNVNTLDLIKIQRHILNLEKLPYNYLLKAADVNDDDKVNVNDLVEIRNVILGKKIKFSGKNSYQSTIQNDSMLTFNSFSMDNYEFYNLAGINPLDIQIFKTGDVTPNTGTTRNKEEVKSINLVRSIESNDQINLFFEEDKINGFQLQLTLTKGQVLDVISPYLDKSKIEYFLESDKLRIIVFDTDFINGASKPDFLKIIISNGAQIELEDLDFSFSNVIIEDKEYSLIQKNSEYNGELKLFPNPWKESTTLVYNSKSSGEAEINIYDTFGKILFSKFIEIVVGDNKITIDNNEIPLSGVYIIEVLAKDKSFTRQMIHVK